MNILFCIANIGSYHDARLERLGKLCKESGHELLVVQYRGKSSFYSHKQSVKESSKTYACVTIDPVRNPIDYIREVRRHHCDVLIQIGYQDKYSILNVLLSKLLGFKVIYCSDSKEDDFARSRINKLFKKLLLTQYHGGFVAGRKHKEFMRGLGFSGPLQIGYDVIDNEMFHSDSQIIRKEQRGYRESFGLPDKYFLIVSRLVERKRVDLAIDAFYSSGLNEEYGLVIVGDGPLKKEISTSLGKVNNGFLISNVDNREMPKLYSLAVCTILASEYDQWGLCANESLACDTPVILSGRCGAANEIVIDGKNGYVFSDAGNTVDNIIKCMWLVVEGTLDGGLKEYCEEFRRSWSTDTFAKNLLRLSKQCWKQ